MPKINAFIGCRLGSTRVKFKNLSLLDKKPLFSYLTESAIKSNNIDNLFLNTDSQYIVDVAKEIWTVGTKYFRLAKDYYGSEEYWWIIAWYNLKPLETDFKPGDVVYIPTPLQNILSIYNVL